MLVEVRVWDYIPTKRLAIITFEVKTAGAVNVQAVYEALNHRQAATSSYVVLHIPPDQADLLRHQAEKVAAAGRTHGIGVLVAGDPGDHTSWRELVKAEQVPLDPDLADEFIGRQLSAAARKQIRQALR